MLYFLRGRAVHGDFVNPQKLEAILCEVLGKILKIRALLRELGSPHFIRLEVPTFAEIQIHLDRDLDLCLFDAPGGEMVQVTSRGRRGIVPRACEGQDGLSVSTADGEDRPYLCLYLDPDDPRPYDDLVDRGLCWVFKGTAGAIISMDFHLCEQKELPEPGRITQLIEQAISRTNQTIDNVLNSEPASV